MQTLQRPSFKNNYLFQIQLFLVVIQARSCNVNEVIRVVLNPLFFFFMKRFCTQQKNQKHKDASKQKHKTTHQKHQKHQKHNDATKKKHKTLQVNSKGMVVPLHQ